MLCYVMLSYVKLSYVTLRYVMLCYVILYLSLVITGKAYLLLCNFTTVANSRKKKKEIQDVVRPPLPY